MNPDDIERLSQLRNDPFFPFLLGVICGLFLWDLCNMIDGPPEGRDK